MTTKYAIYDNTTDEYLADNDGVWTFETLNEAQEIIDGLTDKGSYADEADHDLEARLYAGPVRYAVIDEDDGLYSTFETFCDSIEEAVEEAKAQWAHLTRDEKKERHVFAAELHDDYEIAGTIWDIFWDSRITEDEEDEGESE